MEIAQEISQRSKEIEEILKRYLPKEEGYQKTVIEAMNYSILAGGKRLRPMLMQESYRLFGGSSNVIEPFMAAMEMIHTYSLVHDDLPAMDNDEYRRGKKTTHVAFGEDMGILAGDGLLNFAMETALKAYDREACNLESGNLNIAQALKVLFHHSGIYGMIGGQTLDVELSGQVLDQGQLDFIYRLKTGALIEASMEIGAILAGATDREQKLVVKAASALGLAFQIQDDILDVTSTQEMLGKPIGSDEKNQKTTYVSLKGLKAAKAAVEELSRQSLEAFVQLGGEHTFLTRLVKYLIKRER